MALRRHSPSWFGWNTRGEKNGLKERLSSVGFSFGWAVAQFTERGGPHPLEWVGLFDWNGWVPPEPEAPPPQTRGTSPSRPSKWAALLARIYEVFPLVCPTCQAPLTFIAFLTDPEPITQILAHIGESTSPPLLHPARGPPQTEFHLGPGEAEQDEVAQQLPPNDLDQSPVFDPADPEPIPDDHFDQSWGA